MVHTFTKTLLNIFGVEEEMYYNPCRDFASKEKLKHELELFFPNSSKTSNKIIIFDHSDNDQESINEEFIDDKCGHPYQDPDYFYHSDNDQESINEEFIDEDVRDNTTEEEVCVERIQSMVCLVWIARKLSSSEVRN